MKKQFLLIVSVVLFGVSAAFAQDAPAPPKQISKGVLNGSAVNLVKPAYPAAAKAVNAEGAVNVQVTIDENGSVISASAVSGHPLLRMAATQAAQQSTFAPTLLAGQPVKVTGVIVYNFVADKAESWFKIGYNLASAQHTPSLIFLNTNSIAKSFQPDWTTEKEQLDKLAEIKQAEAANTSFPPPVILEERKISEDTEKKPDGTTVRKVVTRRAVKSDGEPNSEQTAVAQSLVASLQGRLGSDALNSWQFNTGLSLSWAVSKLRYTNERQRVLDSLRSQIQSAPAEVSPEFLADLQALASILEKPTQMPEDREQIGGIMSRLLRR